MYVSSFVASLTPQDITGIELLVTLRSTKEWHPADRVVRNAWMGVNGGTVRQCDPRYYLHLMEMQK
jgi:hypothetical protein